MESYNFEYEQRSSRINESNIEQALQESTRTTTTHTRLKPVEKYWFRNYIFNQRKDYPNIFRFIIIIITLHLVLILQFGCRLQIFNYYLQQTTNNGLHDKSHNVCGSNKQPHSFFFSFFCSCGECWVGTRKMNMCPWEPHLYKIKVRHMGLLVAQTCLGNDRPNTSHSYALLW